MGRSTGEVAGAVAHGGATASRDQDNTGETRTGAAAAVDRVTGGKVSPWLVLGAVVAVGAALALGLRRQFRHW